MLEDLKNHLRAFSTAPFLFVGSGFSQRYLGAETWENLLKRFAGLTPHPYEYYRSSAAGELPAVATQIADKFHEIWWREPQFEQSRRLYGSQAINRESALKIEISIHLRRLEEAATIPAGLAEEVSSLRQAKVDGIITTNWDRFIESIFPDYRPFIGQDQLLLESPQGIGEVYKIHGCVSDPNSFVLTKDDYQRFHQRNSYLAAKLLTVFVEHPVIFLGYSLVDENIRQIIREIGACLTNSNIGQLQNRLVFVSWDPFIREPTWGNSHIVLPDYPIPVKEIRTASFAPIFTALVELPRRFPARLLRRLKEHVYTLVRDNDSKGRIYVKDLETAEAADSEIEMVLGVGVIAAVKDVGYRGVRRDDLIDDILGSSRDFDAVKIVEETLPILAKQCDYMPIFKYLRAAGRLDDSGNLMESRGLPVKVIRAVERALENFRPPEQYQKKARKLVDQYGDFATMAANLSPKEVVMHCGELSESCYHPEAVHEFLVANRESLLGENSLVKNYFVKLVCVYDLLSYRRPLRMLE